VSSETSLSATRIHVVATTFFALFAIVGLSFYGLPFFYDKMVLELGWTRAQVTSGNAISKLIVGPLFGFIAGWMIDRFGPRPLMLAGILMAGTALIGLSTVSTLALFYLFYVFNALGYVCGGPLPCQVLISRWFDRERGRAMGIAYLGIGVGGLIVPLLAAWLITTYGWRPALMTLGILQIVIALPLTYSVKNAPPGAVRADAVITIGPVLRSPAFYLLAIGSMCSIGAVGGTIQNLKLFLSLDLGYTQIRAGAISSLVLTASMVGRVLMGWLADRWPKKYVMLLIYAIVSVAIPLLFFADTPGIVVLFAIVFGIGLGGDYMIIPLMGAELFGVRVLGRLMGIILTVDGVAEAIAPWVVARMRDTTGSYQLGFLTLLVLSVTGAIAIALLPRPPTRMREQPAPVPATERA
jgi:sugar phosphate permease